MNIDEARELLKLLRMAIDTDVSRREIREALTLTGDLPVMSQRERLKRTLYDDSHAFEDDHGGRCPSPPPPPFEISPMQCDAVDDQAGLQP